MKKIFTGLIKACNFYVSEWHLYAAMLPFVRDELNYNNKVVIISQDNLMIGIKNLVNKIDIKFYNKNGINDINWIKDIDELDISSEINPINIFVQGTEDYINNVNCYLSEYLKSTYREIRIVNCYELYDSNNSLYEILDKHDFVFNTGGLKRKEYVFPDYEETRFTKSY